LFVDEIVAVAVSEPTPPSGQTHRSGQNFMFGGMPDNTKVKIGIRNAFVMDGADEEPIDTGLVFTLYENNADLGWHDEAIGTFRDGDTFNSNAVTAAHDYYIGDPTTASGLVLVNFVVTFTAVES
jgi:hypothetical protein